MIILYNVHSMLDSIYYDVNFLWPGMDWLNYFW